nr:hypothetical protein [Tanacetum cinerariifolium]
MEEKSKLDEDLQGKPVDATQYRGMIGSLMYLTSSRPDLIYVVCLCAWYQAKPTEKHLNTHMQMQIMQGVRTLDVVHQEVLNFLVIDLLAGLLRSKKTAISSTEEQVENEIMKLYFVRIKYQLADIFTKPLPGERFNFLIEKLEEDLFTFIKKLGYSGKYDMLSTIRTDQMHLPWRTFVLKTLCIKLTTEKLVQLEKSTCPTQDSPKSSSIISSSKTITSMRNRINLHTARDDTLLGTFKFVSKTEDYQKYRALIPDGMINQDIKDSKSYKTYLDYADGKVAPKKARKFKKPASPKLNIVSASPKEPTQINTLGKSVSKKKAPAKTDRGKGIKLLSDVALLEDAQLKETLKKSKKETHKLQLTAQVRELILNNRFLMSKPERLKIQGDNEDESDDVHDEYNNNDDDGNDDGERDKSDDEDKMYEEEEEDDDVVKELYGDLNITLGLRDINITNVEQGPLQSSSISSDFTSKLLDLDDPSLNINSLMNTSTVPPPPPPDYPSSHPTTIPQQQTPDSTKTTTYPTMTLPIKPRDEKKKLRKDVEPSKGSKYKESKSSSSSKGTQSQSKSSSRSTQAEEPEFEAADIEMQQDQGNESGHIDDQPDNEATSKHDWFQKPNKPPTPDQRKPPRMFDELMGTPIDFSAYVMNRLKIDNLTQEILVGPAFNLLKGTCKSFVELEYHFKECYKAVNDRLDWHNPEWSEYPFDLSKPLSLIEDQGHQVVPADYLINNDLEYLKVKVAYKKHVVWGTYHWGPKRQRFYAYACHWKSLHDVYSKRRIIAVISVKVMRWYDYGYLEKIVVRRDDNVLYKIKEGDFLRLNLCDIKDMLLLLVQKKLSNLDIDDRYDLGVALRMFTRRIVILYRVEDLQLGIERSSTSPNQRHSD